MNSLATREHKSLQTTRGFVFTMISTVSRTYRVRCVWDGAALSVKRGRESRREGRERRDWLTLQMHITQKKSEEMQL